MKLPRRAFLRLAAGAAVVPVLPRLVLAQAYPSRPVRIIVGFAAGSASDILTRLIGQRLSDRLGQPFIVENRGGAGGTLGAEAVVRATPDGYTLLYCGSADAVNATMYDKLNYNFIHDIVPVASMARGPLVLVVHPSFPATTIAEFIAYTKANPGKVAFGSAGIGTVAHMAGELFMAKADVKLVHVPYRGLGQAMTDLLGGQVQAIFSTMPPALGHVKAGRLRALAITSTARSEALPDLPAIGDFLPGYEATLLNGVGVPRNTPANIVERLNKEISAIVAEPEMKARLADLGNVPVVMTPAEFSEALADETKKWGNLIRTAHIQPA
jgi:tripartite-type tricarboxylate transporter receptor subunit TctC